MSQKIVQTIKIVDEKDWLDKIAVVNNAYKRLIYIQGCCFVGAVLQNVQDVVDNYEIKVYFYLNPRIHSCRHGTVFSATFNLLD